MISKRAIKITFPIILLVGLYFIGPAPAKPKFNQVYITVPSEAASLEQYIAENESKHVIKPNNEAMIIWNDSTKQKTEYAIVYL
ncbi:MAG TPA: alpha/beta hydrolase, partial [Chryseolinea sp.]|nr:alpha/beta hydrolase [Chryseolinea sp.]